MCVKFSRCKPPERWRGEFAGSGPKKCNAGLPPRPSLHRPTEAGADLQRRWIQPWSLKKASVFIQVPGKAVGAASCALSIPGSGAAAGTAQLQATARWLWQTNLNPRTKGKNTIKHKEATIRLIAFMSKNVGVLLSDKFHFRIKTTLCLSHLKWTQLSSEACVDSGY